MTHIHKEDLDRIQKEVEWVENLPHGFYLYRGDEYNALVVAQGPIDRTLIEDTRETVEMIGAKFGILVDFVEKIDTPTEAQRKWLIPTKA
jgi:hypothetical protein